MYVGMIYILYKFEVNTNERPPPHHFYEHCTFYENKNKFNIGKLESTAMFIISFSVKMP